MKLTSRIVAAFNTQEYYIPTKKYRQNTIEKIFVNLIELEKNVDFIGLIDQPVLHFFLVLIKIPRRLLMLFYSNHL